MSQLPETDMKRLHLTASVRHQPKAVPSLMSRLIWLLLSAWTAWAFVPSACAQAGQPVSAFVSIAPQNYFVRKVGGDRVHVSVMVEPGSNPAEYEPRPSQITALTGADIYFAIGVPFERTWLKRFSTINPDMSIVFTDSDIKKLPMASHHHPKDSHQQESEFNDPHIWLSPPLVMLQSRALLDGLIRVDPGSSAYYRQNYRQWIQELVELDDDMLNLFQHKGGRNYFMVFHPAWGYFARAYGLEQIPVEIEGKEPKASHLQDFIRLAKRNGLKVMFAQPQFSSKSAKVIADAIGGEIQFIDPLAPDWGPNLRQAAQKINDSLNSPTP